MIRIFLMGALAIAISCGGGDDNGGDGNGDGDGSSGSGLSFFVTSAGNGVDGGDYGGLAGADARCQALATAAGAGNRTWRAYLSTSADFDGEVVDARDRIGNGPWRNAGGNLVASDVADLHANGIEPSLMLDENRGSIPSTEHDLLTGSDADGRVTTRDATDDPATCSNWQSNAHELYGYVGHTDSTPNWNKAHDARCSERGLMGVNGTGRLMCFAAD